MHTYIKSVQSVNAAQFELKDSSSLIYLDPEPWLKLFLWVKGQN